MAKKKKKALRKPLKTSRVQAGLIIAAIIGIGGFFVYRSFASSIPVCASGSRSLGYETAYKNGKPYKIRLCRIEGFLSTGSEDGGWARVSSNASGNWVALFRAARSAGVILVADSSFRSHAKQTQMYNCYKAGKCPLAAVPGYSNHQSGEAIDIDIVPGKGNDPTLTECRRNSSRYPVFDWLNKNGPRYKRYANIPQECWHWSPTGW